MITSQRQAAIEQKGFRQKKQQEINLLLFYFFGTMPSPIFAMRKKIT
jgi:hypothetical protein